MDKLIIGISAILVVSTAGYITVNAYAGQLRTQDKLYLSPVAFFFNVLFIGIINIISNGRILSSQTHILLMVGFFILTHLFVAYPSVKKDLINIRLGIKDHWYQALIFTLLLFFIVYIAVKPMITDLFLIGDFKRHIQFTTQLLNGFTFAHHLPYSEISFMGNSYPFLPHVTMAYFARLFGIHIMDAYFILQLLQAMLLPLGMFILVYKLTGNFWIGIVGMLLCTLYGGLSSQWEQNSWWFNTSLERLLPQHFTRMLSLGIALIFLASFVSTAEYSMQERGETPSALFKGGVLGIIGLTHTYAFVFSFLFILFLYLLRKNKLSTRQALIIVSSGITIALIGYIPSMISLISGVPSGSFDAFEKSSLMFFSRPIGQVFLTPSKMLSHFGMIGIAGVLSICFLTKLRKMHVYTALWLSVLFILILTWSKGLLSSYFQLSLPYHPTQQKFGKIIFLVCVISSCGGVNYLIRSIQKYSRIKRAAQLIIGLILVYMIQPGIYTTLEFAKKVLDRHNKYIHSSFLAPSNIVSIIRNTANKEDVIAVPKNIRSNFTCLTGLNTLLLDHPKAHSFSREFAREILFAPEKVRIEIEKDYSLDYQEIIREVLNRYRITYIIVPHQNKRFYGQLDYLTYFGKGTWWVNAKEFLIFKVNNHADYQDKGIHDQEKGGDYHQKLDQFFSSERSFQQVVGYYPLVRNRYLRPGLMDSRGLKAVGMTWDGQGFWLSFEKKKKLVKVDPETGKIIDTLKNPCEKSGGIAWDGKALWSVDASGKKIVKIDIKTGKIIKSIQINLSSPQGLEWYNDRLWAIDVKDHLPGTVVYEIDTKSGHITSEIRTNKTTKGIAFGQHMVLSIQNRKVFRYKIENTYPTEKKSILKNNSVYPGVLAVENDNLWCFDGRTSALVQFKDTF